VSVERRERRAGTAEEGFGWGRGSKRGVKVLYHDQAGSSSNGILALA
jgi:hypothetical protein